MQVDINLFSLLFFIQDEINMNNLSNLRNEINNHHISSSNHLPSSTTNQPSSKMSYLPFMIKVRLREKRDEMRRNEIR